MANGDVQAVAQPVPEEQDRQLGVPDPNSGMRSKSLYDFGNELIRSSFSFFGSAAADYFDDPNLALPFERMGERTHMNLQNRWHQKEFENFKTQHMNPYLTKSDELKNNVLERINSIDRNILINPDGSTQPIERDSMDAVREKHNILTNGYKSIHQLDDEFLMLLEQYKQNPLIDSLGQRLLENRARQIAEIVGPSQTQAADMQMAQIEKLKAEAAAAKRGPESARVPKDSELTPNQLLEKKGIPGVIEYLSGAGRDRVAPYFDANRGVRLERAAVRDPEVRFDEAKRSAVLNKGATEDMNWAVGDWFRLHVPAYAHAMQEMPQFSKFFRPATEMVAPPQVTALPNKKEQRAMIRNGHQVALQKFNAVAAGGAAGRHAKSLSEALNIWIEEVLDPDINETFAAGVPELDNFKKEFRRSMIAYVKQNWKQAEAAKQRFGRAEIKREKRQKETGFYKSLLDKTRGRTPEDVRKGAGEKEAGESGMPRLF